MPANFAGRRFFAARVLRVKEIDGVFAEAIERVGGIACRTRPTCGPLSGPNGESGSLRKASFCWCGDRRAAWVSNWSTEANHFHRRARFVLARQITEHGHVELVGTQRREYGMEVAPRPTGSSAGAVEPEVGSVRHCYTPTGAFRLNLFQ